MKNWWLELYTFPFLKELLRAFLIVFGATAVIAFINPQMYFISALLTVYLSYIVRKYALNSLSANIEFHKLHVPYPELKKAMLIDSCIRIIAPILAIIACLCIIIATASIPAGEGNLLFTVLFSTHTVMFAQMMALRKTAQAKKKQPYFTDRWHPFLSFLFGIVLLLGVFVGMVVLEMLEFAPIIVAVYLGAGAGLFYYILSIRALFHIEKDIGSLKTFLKYSTKGFATGLVAYALSVVCVRPLVNNHDLMVDSKLFFYDITGPFAPQLEVETVKDFMVADLYLSERVKIFNDAAPEFFYRPLFSVLEKPNMEVLMAYMETVKHPSVEDMKLILDYSSKLKVHPRHKAELANMIVTKWPKHEKFPEQYLDQKVRLPASVKNVRVTDEGITATIIPDESESEK